MAAKKKAAAPKNIMEELQSYSPTWNEPAEEKKDVDPNAGLLERLAKIEGELAESRRQQAYAGFAQPQAAPQKDVGPPKKESFEPDLKDLPDPVSHPKEYSAEYAKRLNASFEKRIEADRASQAAQAEQANLAQRVWDGFKSVQPEWAKHEMLAQAAAGKVGADMASRGVDIVRMVKTQPDLFYNEVAALLEKQYPQLKAEKEEDDGGEEHRTAGVFGGTPGKQGKDTGELPTEEQDNDAFVRGIREMQFKGGLR